MCNALSFSCLRLFFFERLLCSWVFHLLIAPSSSLAEDNQGHSLRAHGFSYGLLLETGPIDFTGVTLLTSRKQQEDVGCVIYSTIGEAFQKLAAHEENPIPLFMAVKINQELLAIYKNMCRVYAGGPNSRGKDGGSRCMPKCQ